MRWQSSRRDVTRSRDWAHHRTLLDAKEQAEFWAIERSIYEFEADHGLNVAARVPWIPLKIEQREVSHREGRTDKRIISAGRLTKATATSDGDKLSRSAYGEQSVTSEDVLMVIETSERRVYDGVVSLGGGAHR